MSLYVIIQSGDGAGRNAVSANDASNCGWYKLLLGDYFSNCDESTCVYYVVRKLFAISFHSVI